MTDDVMPGIPDAWVTAGVQGVIALHKRKRDMPWTCPSSEDVAAVLAAVLPLERERIAEDFGRLADDLERFPEVPPGVPGIEREAKLEAWLAAVQVALHGLSPQEHSDEKRASNG